ncbi:MAG: hypothetical protein ACREDP_25200, partial [Bradyrhizobium sp.]
EYHDADQTGEAAARVGLLTEFHAHYVLHRYVVANTGLANTRPIWQVPEYTETRLTENRKKPLFFGNRDRPSPR